MPKQSVSHKADLIAAVAAESGQSKAVVRGVLDAAGDVIAAALVRGEEAFLVGLGKLATSPRGPRRARHMRTGEPVIVPERTALVYRPYAPLVRALNADA